MKILFVTRGYPNARYKNLGLFEFDQAKALVASGHDVIYASLDLRSIRRSRKWGAESLLMDGVTIEGINWPVGRVPQILFDALQVFAMKRLYRRIEKKYGRPDIIHAHFLGMGFVTAQVFEKSDIPLVMTEHYSKIHKDELGRHYLEKGKRTYPKMDHVIAVGHSLAESIERHFDVKAAVIPNIVDTAVFYFDKTNCEKDDRSFHFVAVGRLIAIKRMDLLIEAFYDAFKDDQDAKLTIYGEGPMRPTLEKQIDALGMRRRICLAGLVQRERLAEAMHCADCFVLASQKETFGLAFAEAMAAGLPVIATKSGGPEDFVDESRGLLIPVDDKELLVDALTLMRQQASNYDRQAIATSIKALFSPKAIAAKLDMLYRSVMS